jgi:uncharacterized protein YbaR (Trm112 family)
MADETRNPEGFEPSILERLACPVCLGGLCCAEAGLRCEGCGRVYPIVDGIPVLIGERAGTTGESRGKPQLLT